MPEPSSAHSASQKVALYANVGAELTHYDVDVAGAELIKRGTVTLPASVQYAWPDVSRRYLYVATSSARGRRTDTLVHPPLVALLTGGSHPILSGFPFSKNLNLTFVSNLIL